ncbi:MAG TPA: hypothetical protein VN844_30190 [Pyrinomonadaceae bacterium]|nr:hypothetical protein [Pyrinomonadaceae bacterium]
MICFSRLAVSMALLISAVSVGAQTPAKKPPAPETRRDAETKRKAKARQQQAASLLLSLATDARSFRDLTLRARSLASIADLLWDLDRDQARILFTKAWDAADAAERENTAPVNLREEVLRLAARHDRALAETFLESLKTDRADKQAEEVSRNSLWGPSEDLAKRLSLARNLLAGGDVKRALEFAEPALGTATISTLEFLTQLREHDASAADRFYAGMISRIPSGPEEANSISLLASYLFTPHMYVMFTPDGQAETSWQQTTLPPINVDPQLRLNFFQTAAGVLLQPVEPSEKNQNQGALVIRFMVLQRLLPLFEQFGPSSLTASLRSQLPMLRELIGEDVQSAENEWLRKGLGPQNAEFKDREKSILDQIDRAKTSSERDDLYLKLALLALENDKNTARDYADKIEESDLRKQVLAWVDWSTALRSIEQKKFEAALALARKGELTHIQRVWILTQVAGSLAQSDREKALTVIDDAIREVERIDNSDPDQPRGLFAIANALKGVDDTRAWEIAFDAVKAGNSAESFTGEDGKIFQGLRSSTQIFQRNDPAVDFDVKGVFGKLAATDADRTIELARAFQAEGPRAIATIAIAKALLK